jgi:hypothetical protein
MREAIDWDRWSGALQEESVKLNECAESEQLIVAEEEHLKQ